MRLMWSIFEWINLFILKRFAFFTVCLLLCIKHFAQPAKQYAFTHFSTSNGLVTNIVNSVVQDHKGYMWFATIDGLQRYDDNNFLTFRNESNDSNSLPNDFITDVFEDKHEDLWVWSGDEVGIFNTHNFTFTHIPVEGETEKEKPFIRFLTEDGNGYAAIYVDKKGIYTYDNEKKIFKGTCVGQFPKDWLLMWMRSFPKENRIFLTSPQGMAVYNFKTGDLNYSGHNPDNDKFIQQIGNDTAALYVYNCEGDNISYETWPQGVPFVNYANIK